jgi:NhaP-type Na+/H+ and K+/H+ antiporter
MKNKILFAALILTVVAVFASCASQKYGCPMTQTTSRFKG